MKTSGMNGIEFMMIDATELLSEMLMFNKNVLSWLFAFFFLI